MNRAQFVKTYRCMTPNQKCRIAIAIHQKDKENNLFATPFCWNDIYREVIKNSITGKKLLEALG